MSRPSALRETLQLPLGHALEVVSVPASGDCFYDCIGALLVRDRDECGASSETDPAAARPLLRGRDASTSADIDGGGDGGGGVGATPSPQFLRDYVAERLTSEQLDLYRTYAAAGLDEYAFATDRTLEELKTFARRSGRANGGPGRCFWADEFALRTVSEGLRLTLLIVDDQAARGTGGAGRKRRRNEGNDRSPKEVDNRFIFIGRYPRGVILHRSRRQHYNAVVVDGRPVAELEQLPSSVKSRWPALGRLEQSDAKPEPAKAELGNNTMKGNWKTIAFTSDDTGKELPPSCRDGLHQKPKSSDGPGGETSASHLTSKNASSSTLPRTHALGNFYCGCAGFSSSSWVGNFYPKSLVGNRSDRQLDHYQQHFRAVEINSTFYGIPTESTVNKWKEAFAKSFKVAMKTPRGLTHEGTWLDCSVLSTFLSRMRPLSKNLACILIQCPRTLAVTVDQLEQLKRTIDEEAIWYTGRVAFEFRNQATYDDDEVRQFLRRSNYVLVMHPDSLGRSTVGTSTSGRGSCSPLEYEPEKLSKVAAAGTVTSDVVYLRLHGFNDEHRGEYTLDQLKEMATQIHSWRVQGLEVFCFFLNDMGPTRQHSSPSPRKSSSLRPWDGWCAMPKNAKQLESFVFDLSYDVTPDAPKKPKSTLLNFFGKKKG